MTPSEQSRIRDLSIQFGTFARELTSVFDFLSTKGELQREAYEVKSLLKKLGNVLLSIKIRKSSSFQIPPPYYINKSLHPLWIESTAGLTQINDAFKAFTKACSRNHVKWIRPR